MAKSHHIVFDDDARRSFLTGFQKRKQARREHARKRAQLREKQERRETRREHRRALAERAARNAAEVESAYGALACRYHPTDDEWPGLASEPDAVEEAFEGEEQFATVTVVQDFDLSALLHGPAQTGKPAEAKEAGDVTRTRRRPAQVRYETKAARRAEQRKQWARRSEKVERAGRKRK